MALFRKFFYRKPPDGLLEISERVYVFDCCFTTDVLEEDEYRVYIGGIVSQLREHSPDASFMVFNFREGEHQSQIAEILSEYDMTVMDYPRHYEGCPLLTMEMIHHFLRSSESWLSLGQQNVLLMHCERGGWPVLAFMLAGLLIYRKHYTGEQKTLEMIYKQAPRELLQLLSPLNPLPSQLRYLQYISRRNVGSQWPPLDRTLTLDCVILRILPNFDGEGGCRPIFRIYGQDPILASDRTPKVLFSTPKKSRSVRLYRQADCELVKIDIHCHIQGDVVLECITLDEDLEREEMMFRVMFNTAFIRSNILMLNRDEIDILWDAKDRFPKDFRAEVLLSEMDAAASLVTVELASGEEKEGLPVEAFAKVQEIFSTIDWVDGKGDAALHVLQKLTLSNVFQEKLDSVSPRKSEIDLPQKSGPDVFKEKVKLDEDVEKSSPSDPMQQSTPSQQKSSDSDTKNQNVKHHHSQIALQRPSQPKMFSERVPKSLSPPVSSVNSLQSSPVSVSRYHSAPSAIGITALLQDHDLFMNSDVAHYLTMSPSAPSLAAVASSGSFEPSATKIASPPPSLAEPKIILSPPPAPLTPVPSTVSPTKKSPITPSPPQQPAITVEKTTMPITQTPPPPLIRPMRSAAPAPRPPPLPSPKAPVRSAPPPLLPPPPTPTLFPLQRPSQLPQALPTPEHPALKPFKPTVPTPPPPPPRPCCQEISSAVVSPKSDTSVHIPPALVPSSSKPIPPSPPPIVSSSTPPPPPLPLALFSLLVRKARTFLLRHRLKRTQSVQWFIGDDGERLSRNGSCPKSKIVKEGVEFFGNGDLYEGEFYKGSCNGSGVFNFFAKGRYEGDWVDGKYDGYGIESWAKGSRYKGQYRNGSRHGFGVYRFFNGDSYAGEWFSGQSHGRGVQTCADGSCYVGEFKAGVKHGLGYYHFRNGDRYAGEYFGDKIHGFGVYHFANGHCYEGSWHEGRRQGFGTYTFRSGEMSSGEWDCGVQKHSLQPSDHSVQRSVQAARKAAENAVLAPRVDEQVNKAVAAANRAATAARVAAIKAVQNRMDGKFCHTDV